MNIKTKKYSRKFMEVSFPSLIYISEILLTFKFVLCIKHVSKYILIYKKYAYKNNASKCAIKPPSSRNRVMNFNGMLTVKHLKLNCVERIPKNVNFNTE